MLYNDPIIILNLQAMATSKKKTTPAKKDPCWDGYEQVGMKQKKGKPVPNCVPEKAKKKSS